jgi:hypothetical protein
MLVCKNTTNLLYYIYTDLLTSLLVTGAFLSGEHGQQVTGDKGSYIMRFVRAITKKPVQLTRRHALLHGNKMEISE